MGERLPSGLTHIAGVPLSPWCLRMVNNDPLSDLDPSGLVWCFPHAARPTFAYFMCKPSASRIHRCGGVFALAHGLGSDKGPEHPAVMIHFTRDPDGRFVCAMGKGGKSFTLGTWRDNEWCAVRLRLDWDRKVARCQLNGYNDRKSTNPVTEVPFKNPACPGCRFLLLYNQTGE